MLAVVTGHSFLSSHVTSEMVCEPGIQSGMQLHLICLSEVMFDTYSYGILNLYQINASAEAAKQCNLPTALCGLAIGVHIDPLILAFALYDLLASTSAC